MLLNFHKMHVNEELPQVISVVSEHRKVANIDGIEFKQP